MNRRTARVPHLLLGGMVVLAVAGVLDIGLHLVGGPAGWETAAHVAVLAGMVATLAGVVHGGRPHGLSPSENKEIRNAIR
jgi:hypothetical protein